MAVAAPKKMAKKKGDPKRPTYPVLSMRGSQEWKEWVDELADFLRLRTPDVVDKALVDLATKSGFTKPPPKR